MAEETIFAISPFAFNITTKENCHSAWGSKHDGYYPLLRLPLKVAESALQTREICLKGTIMSTVEKMTNYEMFKGIFQWIGRGNVIRGN